MNVPLVRSDLARPRPLVEERTVGIVIGTAVPQDRASRNSADESEKSSSRDHFGRKVNMNEGRARSTRDGNSGSAYWYDAKDMISNKKGAWCSQAKPTATSLSYIVSHTSIASHAHTEPKRRGDGAWKAVCCGTRLLGNCLGFLRRLSLIQSLMWICWQVDVSVIFYGFRVVGCIVEVKRT